MEVLDRWVQRLHAAVDRLAALAAPRLQDLQGSMGATRSNLRRQARLMREDSEEWTESLRVTVRECPVRSLVLAVAFGMLLSSLRR